MPLTPQRCYILPLALLFIAALIQPIQVHGQTSLFDLTNDSDESVLNVFGDGGFVIRGTQGTGTISTSGYGTRLMWHPAKAALRAGQVGGTQWDEANVGDYSLAVGANAQASGTGAVALGDQTDAEGTYALAVGSQNTASGIAAVALGASTAAEADYTTALGWNTTAATLGSLSLGVYNSANTDDDGTLLVVGNGSSDATRSDALVLDGSGDLQITGTLTESSDRRLKTAVRPIADGVTKKLAAIHPVRYRFRTGTGHPTDEQLGLIAQEV